MDNIKQDGVFHFTYSAEEQEELKAIQKKYLPTEEDKIQKIRNLDAHVTNKATTISILTGIGGMLILGIGMCCCLVWQGIWFIPGIVIGITGMIIAGIAYPAYLHIIKKERKKIAPEILRLTEELFK